MNFQLHPRLEQDCIEVGRSHLYRLLLMNDCQYPWCILVPERKDITEIYQLEKSDRLQLAEASSLLAQELAEIYNADKINIATIGNLVPQLHIHHIVRFRTDKTWPSPVWGKFNAVPYDNRQLKETLFVLRQAFRPCLID